MVGMIIVKENFLPNLDLYLKNIREIPVHSIEEYSKITNDYKVNFPGKRSDALLKANPFLYCLINNEISKINLLKKYSIDLYIHLKTEKDIKKDWIHKDGDCDYTTVIYLNNILNAGTYFYDKDTITADIKYKQNRMIFFNSNILHMAYGEVGKDLLDGRLTIVGFIKNVN